MLPNVLERTGSAVKQGALLAWRHKGKLLLGATAVGGVYAYHKLRSTWDQVKGLFDAQLTGERRDRRMQLEARFEHIMALAKQNVQVFAHRSVRPALRQRFPAEEIRARLVQAKAERKRRAEAEAAAAAGGAGAAVGSPASTQHDLQAWEDFKVVGVARVITAMYEACLLHSLLHVQLSVAGRHEVHQAWGSGEGAEAGAGPQEDATKAFMDVFQFAKGEGLEMLANEVEAIVRDVLSPEDDPDAPVWSLKRRCSLEDMRLLLMRIHSEIDTRLGGPGSISTLAAGAKPVPVPFGRFVFPPHAEPVPPPNVLSSLSVDDNGADPPQPHWGVGLRVSEMVHEAQDVMRTPSFRFLLQGALEAGNGMIMSQLASLFSTGRGGQAAIDAGADVDVPVVRFASALMRLSKIFDVLLPAHADTPSPLFVQLNEQLGLRNLCAVIFFPDSADAHADADGADQDPADALNPADLRELLNMLGPGTAGAMSGVPTMNSNH